MPRAVKDVFKKMRASKFSGGSLMRGVKQGANFLKGQLNHPAAKQLAADSAGIIAGTGGNLEAAAPMLGARLAEEAGATVDRTIRHYGGGSKFGQFAGRAAATGLNRMF